MLDDGDFSHCMIVSLGEALVVIYRVILLCMALFVCIRRVLCNLSFCDDNIMSTVSANEQINWTTVH